MAAGKEQRSVIERSEAGNDPVSAGAHLRHRFTTRTAVAEELPARTPLENLSRRQAVVIAVVPFDQVGIDLCHGAEAGQFAGAFGPLQRAGEDVCEGPTAQMLAEPAGLAFAALGEWDVGQAGVPSRFRPSGLAVA